MKKIILSIATIASLFLWTGCTSLDLEPTSSITDANYWKTPDHYTAFMNGVHSRFRGHSYNFFLIGEARSDMFLDIPFGGEATQGMERFPYNTLSESSPGISNYGEFYTNINQINLMIVKTINTTILTEDAKNYYLGQLHGIRAYYYFHILRTWGPAVISTEPTFSLNVGELGKAASSQEDVMTLIKEDIKISCTSFGSDFTIKGKKSQWSKAASLMLKGEVYLWSAKQMNGGTKDATEAKAAFVEIQKNIPQFTLEDNFKDIFDYNNKGNNEIIFAFRSELKEFDLWNNSFSRKLLPQANYLGTYYDGETGKVFDTAEENRLGMIQLGITKEHYHRFDDLDTRKKQTLKGVYNMSEDKTLDLVAVFCYKYQGVQDAGNTRSMVDDSPVYRYADLLLSLAEAKVMLGESPKEEINQVRQRAYGSNYSEAKFGFPNQSIDSNVEEAILEERFKEFMIEGKRWYDLRRFGSKYVFKYTLAEEDNVKKLLWPIDKKTLTNNIELHQTPGYEVASN